MGEKDYNQTEQKKEKERQEGIEEKIKCMKKERNKVRGDNGQKRSGHLERSD